LRWFSQYAAGKKKKKKRFNMSSRDFRHPDVRLRNIEPDDLPLLYEWQLDPESNRLAVTNPRSREEFVTHWTGVLSDSEVKACAILVGDKLAGQIACFAHDGQTNVGYWINRNNWGKGIATRALELLLLEVPIRPLYAHVASSNLASLCVLQKCGFVVERMQFSAATNRYPACEEAILVLITSEQYTPGATQNASDFMARRTIASHGQFFLAHLTPGVSVLDCGCGPGTISLSIAQRIAPGQLIGIDREPSQIEKAQTSASQTGQLNAEFQCSEIYTLPFLDNSFDRIFSHALIEHLSDPIRAAKEMFRVLKPGGIIGVCSPDWGGFVLAPPTAPRLDQENSNAIRSGGTEVVSTHPVTDCP
jgi:RimJ/RimL family protein N-acetyltransferase/predicted O-methyltransferase YrrM